jgi:hypothetical protein
VAGEVTTLKHELGNDTMEAGASISVSILTGTQLAEVPRGLRYDIIKKLEDDAPCRGVVDSDVEL